MDNILNVLRRITVNGMLAGLYDDAVGGFGSSIGHVMALSAVLCIGFEKVHGQRRGRHRVAGGGACAASLTGF